MQVARVDTIAARATPRGASALSIVRLTGSSAIPIAATVFEGTPLEEASSHTAHVGYVRGTDGGLLDQVVATVFKAPRTATGEDVVEFSCHGGDVVSDTVLERLLQAGARHAEPGEFTLRAFLNGKIDLAQAEAIGDLIHAQSQRASRISVAHIRGHYSNALSSIRDQLLELIALIELELDFAEEDVEFADRSKLEELLLSASDRLESLLASFRLGSAVSNGVRVVIAGRPNAGKSTFVNALVGYDRVMVSSIPGTTRDEIDVDVEYRGVRFQFVDTAGLRETTDILEAEGVRRSEAAFATADLVLVLLDLSDDKSAFRSVLDELSQKQVDIPLLVLGNKKDLYPGAAPSECAFTFAAKEATESDLERIMNLIYSQTVGDRVFSGEEQVVTSQRHHAHLQVAFEATERAIHMLKEGGSGDLLSADVRSVIEQIGSITGEVTNEDILGKIFSSFCIGK